jgi:hypothetical protein
MGNLTKGHPKIDAILMAVPTLADALTEAAQWLSCRDQVKQLTDGVESVLTQAQRAQNQANLDYRIKSETALRRELVDLAINAAFWVFDGRAPSRSERASTGPRLGEVLIAVGPGGLPEDSEVVNVSELAQQEGKTDGEIQRTFSEKGHVLFTVEELKPLVSWLKEEVLSGRVSLPYHPPAPNLTSATPAIRLRMRR